MNIEINQRQLFLLYYIFKNYLKPVNKLINKEELYEILDHYTFHNELYSLPYLFFVDKSINTNEIDCFYNNKFVCTLKIECYYSINFNDVAFKMFKTNDMKHPGVNDLYSNMNNNCLSALIHEFNEDVVLDLKIPYIIPTFNYSCVFQSRNPPHRAHEFIIKKYKENLLYSTPYETTKDNDYNFDIKIKCYNKIKELYDIDILVTLLPRVFAGPREALQNVLLFKNFGCKSFIGGRGKNCVGDYYTPNESMDFCKNYENISGMNIIHEQTLYNNDVELKASSIKQEYINKGIVPPEELMSSYISEILLNG